MVNVLISDIADGVAISDTDLFDVEQSGTSGKVTGQQYADYIQSKNGLARTFFADYDDSATASSPINVVAGTWTKLTCDALGSSTYTNDLPSGYSLWDTVNNRIDISDLSQDSRVSVRYDFIVTTSINNVGIKIRFKFNSDTPFYKTSRLPRMDEGSGDYEIFGPFNFYVGSGIVGRSVDVEVITTSSTQIEVKR